MSVTDGRYRAYPTSCEEKEGESSGEAYLEFQWKITSTDKGKKASGKVYDNCSLQPQALWRLKTLLELWGIEADGEIEVDPDDLIGEDKEIVIEITNEKFKGKDKPRITGFSAIESEDDDGGDEDDDDEEEKPAKKPGKKSSKKDDDEDDDEADDGDDDEEDEKPGKKPAGKKDQKVGKEPKIKEGSKVQFEDDGGKTIKGTVTEIDDDTAKIEDRKGEEWEVPVENLELQ